MKCCQMRGTRGVAATGSSAQLSTDPFFVLSTHHPPSSHPSTPYAIRAWRTSSTGLEGGLKSPYPPPPNWVTAAGQ